MSEISKKAVEDIVKAVLGFIPGASLLSGTVEAAASLIAARVTGANREIVADVTDRVFTYLTTHAESISPQDPGRAASAAHDIIDTLRAAKIDAGMIVECDLNADRLYDRLVAHEPREHKWASAGRITVYHEYMRELAHLLVNASLSSPVIQAKAMQRILQQVSEIRAANKGLLRTGDPQTARQSAEP